MVSADQVFCFQFRIYVIYAMPYFDVAGDAFHYYHLFKLPLHNLHVVLA